MGEDRKTTKQASKILNIIQLFWCLLTLKMNIFWKFSDLSLVFVLQWVQDGSPSKSTPIKVESPNQFVPLGTTKKEFKRIQAAVNIYFQSFTRTTTTTKLLWELKADISIFSPFSDNFFFFWKSAEIILCKVDMGTIISLINAALRLLFLGKYWRTHFWSYRN